MDEFDYWRFLDELSIVEAALLTVGVIPTSLDGVDVERMQKPERPIGYEPIKLAISAALKKELIKGTCIPFDDTDWNGNTVGIVEGSVDPAASHVQVDSLVLWLRAKGVRSGFFFPNPVEAADYLDESHPRFSAKLAAAVRAWQAMEDDNLRRGKSAMNAMAAWLEANYKSLGLSHKRTNEKNGYKAGEMNKTAIAEAAKISNWEIDGGPPPTPTM